MWQFGTMNKKMTCPGITGWILIASVFYVKFSYEQNVTSTPGAIGGNTTPIATTGNYSEIDYETLSVYYGVTHEFANQFRINLLKAIEQAKEQETDPLRQGEFGGVNGGFYQGGGGQGGGFGGGGGGGGAEEEDYEEDDGPVMPTTPGPGAFGVLSGLFGIFSGLGTLSPTRIIQSTVNFFPPGQRMMAQMIVDSLIGYTPPENRTARPRPRTRRTTTTPLPVMEMMETTPVAVIESKGNETEPQIIDAKVAEETNSTASGVDTDTVTMSAVTGPTTTPEPDFINVHEILNRTTVPPPPTNEDDEGDVQKREYYNASVPIANSSSSSYKIRPKAPIEDDAEEPTSVNGTVTTLTPPVSYYFKSIANFIY